MEKVSETQDITAQDRLKQQLDALDSKIEEHLDHRRKRYALTPLPTLAYTSCHVLNIWIEWLALFE